MQAVTLGIDLGKRWFHVVGLSSTGHVVLREKLNRAQLHHLFATYPACVMALETCCGAQHLGRLAAHHGHDVRLIPAQHVRPFVKSQKNDFNDATALAEVARLPSMRTVPLRTVEQVDIQAIHRARQRVIENRNGLVNQIRGLVLDRGIAIPQGLRPLRAAVPTILEDAQNGLTPQFRNLLATLFEILRQTEVVLDRFTEQLHALARESRVYQRLQTVPGVGPLVATALVSLSVMPAHSALHETSRPGSGWFLVNIRQAAKPRLLGITKRGNTYLRRLFVQGARALWVWKDKRDDPLHRWIRGLGVRMHPHVAVCALANKLVRICWAVLRGDDTVFSHASAAG